MLLPLITGEARHCFWPFHLQGWGGREGDGEEASDSTHPTQQATNPASPTTLHRGVDTALHRSVCDFCSSTIFGGYYFCKKCGRDYCLQCERYFPDSMEAIGESPWELTDAARPRLLKCIKQPWEEMMSGGGGEIESGSTENGNGNDSAKTNGNANTNGGSSTNKNGRKREKAIAWHVRSDLQPVSRFTKEEIEGHWLSLAEFVIGHGYGPDASSSSGFGPLFDAGDGVEPEGEKKKEEWRLHWERMLRVMGLQMDEEVDRVLEQWRKDVRVVREKEKDRKIGLVAHLGPSANIESNSDTNTNPHPVSNPESSSRNTIDSQASIDKTLTSIPGSAVTPTKNETQQEHEVDEDEDLETGEPRSAGEKLNDMMEKEDEEGISAALTAPTPLSSVTPAAFAAVPSPTPISGVEIPLGTSVTPTISSSNSPQVNAPLEESSAPSISRLRSVPTSDPNPKTAPNPTPSQQQNLKQISFNYTKHTHPNPPSDPANLSNYSLPFIYLPSPEGLNNKAFDELWSKGEPIVIGGVNVHVGGGDGGQRRREGEEWGPEKFMERFGEEQCSVVDCQSDTPLVSTVGAFFAAFGESVSKPGGSEEGEKRKEKKRQGILKLKVGSFSIGRWIGK